eukprot:m.12499 g.12499  ORF g.12499 m.12499 type:complete len:258 (+) comp5830_c0_seq1:150-923(+)
MFGRLATAARAAGGAKRLSVQLTTRAAARHCLTPLRPSNTRSLSMWTKWFGSKEEKEKLVEQNKIRKEQLVQKYRDEFQDMREFKKNKGKRGIAPNALNKVGSASAFPTICGISTSGKQVNAADVIATSSTQPTLVLSCCRDVARPMLEEYRKAFKAAYPSSAVYQIVILEGFHRHLKNMVAKAFAQDLDAADKDNVIVVTEQTEAAKNALEMFSSMTAYAYLVDSQNRIRWMAHGQPTAGELESLASLPKQLMKGD